MLTIGDKVNFSALEDQHGNSFSHEEVMELAIFLQGMESKELVREAVVEVGNRCLNRGVVVYVADISKMRKYGYPVWLYHSGGVTELLPVRAGMISDRDQ